MANVNFSLPQLVVRFFACPIGYATLNQSQQKSKSRISPTALSRRGIYIKYIYTKMCFRGTKIESRLSGAFLHGSACD
jgi:hypothetical protein